MLNRRAFLATPAFAAAAQQGATQSPAAARPRLYFTTADAARLRTRITRDPAFAARSQRMLDGARRMLNVPLVPEEDALRGGGQHANYGQPSAQISGMGLTLGLAWHLTGERPFAEKLRAALLHYAAYQRWNAPGKEDRVPQWKSELNGGRFCYGMACGYDALHAFLTAEERKTIAASMVRNGILPVLEDWLLPETRIHALDSMGHNWWSVCVAMAGLAALSLSGDDERTAEWLERVSSGLAEWFAFRGNVLQNKTANFDPAGGFYEGIGYSNYALSEYLRFRLAHSNVFPQIRQPRFQALDQIVDFYLHTLYPTTDSFLTVNFGDSALQASAAPTVRLLLETGFANPSAGWYLEKAAHIRMREGFDPLELLARQPAPAAPPYQLPRSAEYGEIGWATLRDSWRDDATMLAVRSGFTWNHAHADAGSFVLFHQGAPLITDSGTCNYANPLYGRYYVQSRAHNVVLFNGEGQPPEDGRRGVKTPGSVHGMLDAMGVQYVFADSTGPTARRFSRNFRHWLWTGGVILIFDDLLAHEAGRIDWLLHYGGTAKVEGARVQLVNGAAKAEVRFLAPAVSHREEPGFADHHPDTPTPFLAFSPREAARETKFVVAIIPGGVAVEVEPLAAPLATGARIHHGGEVTDVWLNLQADGRRMHDNSNLTLDGWETDAYLFALTRPAGAQATPGTVTRYFVSGASYLRRQGRVMLDSLSKVEAVWKPGDETELAIEGQSRLEVSLGVPAGPRRFIVNGREARFQYRERTRLATYREQR